MLIGECKRHRCTKILQIRDISGVAEVTAVIIRSVLPSTGQMKDNNFYLFESSYCKLTIHHHQPFKEKDTNHENINVSLYCSTFCFHWACFVFLSLCRFQEFSQIQQRCLTTWLLLDTDATQLIGSREENISPFCHCNWSTSQSSQKILYFVPPRSTNTTTWLVDSTVQAVFRIRVVPLCLDWFITDWFMLH